MQVIRELALAGSASVSEIASRLKLTWQDVSLHMNRLEKLGIVEVQAHASALRGRKTRVYKISQYGLLLIPFEGNEARRASLGKVLLRKAFQTMKDSLEVISLAATLISAAVYQLLSMGEVRGTYFPRPPTFFHLGTIVILIVGAVATLTIFVSRRRRHLLRQVR